MTSTTRTAIVTGGSRGIGAATAARLAANGMAVVVVYRDGTDEADEVVAGITQAGGHAIAVQGDVADEADVAAMFDATEAAFGGVDVVVHAAGIMRLSPLADTDLDTFDAIQRVNLRGTFLVMQQAARRLRDGGSIVALSTSVIGLALPTYAAYAASKGAVEAMIPILTKELRGRDINVNAVAPGPTATALFLDGKDEQTIQRLASAPPMERLGTPEDTAQTVAFLTGPGHWVNGQILRANGGIV